MLRRPRPTGLRGASVMCAIGLRHDSARQRSRTPRHLALGGPLLQDALVGSPGHRARPRARGRRTRQTRSERSCGRLHRRQAPTLRADRHRSRSIGHAWTSTGGRRVVRRNRGKPRRAREAGGPDARHGPKRNANRGGTTHQEGPARYGPLEAIALGRRRKLRQHSSVERVAAFELSDLALDPCLFQRIQLILQFAADSDRIALTNYEIHSNTTQSIGE